jgi:hypothetical protein
MLLGVAEVGMTIHTVVVDGRLVDPQIITHIPVNTGDQAQRPTTPGTQVRGEAIRAMSPAQSRGLMSAM